MSISRDKVITHIKPSAELGDRGIYKAFVKYTTNNKSKKLSRGEVKSVVRSVGKKININELYCLRVVELYENLTPEGRQYLNKCIGFLYFIFRKKKDFIIKPMKSSYENYISKLIAVASSYPYKFTLPNGKYEYRFHDLGIVHKAIINKDITLFFYTKDSCRGSYFSSRDCLLLKKDHFKSGSLMAAQSTTIHEAFHALQDGRDFCSNTVHFESAAHLAQAIWLLKENKEIPSEYKRLNNGFAKVAKKIINNKGRDTYHVNQAEFSIMRTVLMASNTYKERIRREKITGTVINKGGDRW